jgi:hypothetical protein
MEEKAIAQLKKMGFEVHIDDDADKPYRIHNTYDEEVYAGNTFKEAYFKCLDKLKDYMEKYSDMYYSVKGLKYTFKCIDGRLLISDLLDERDFNPNNQLKVTEAGNLILSGVNILSEVVDDENTELGRKILVNVLHEIENCVYTPNELDRLYKGLDPFEDTCVEMYVNVLPTASKETISNLILDGFHYQSANDQYTRYGEGRFSTKEALKVLKSFIGNKDIYEVEIRQW